MINTKISKRLETAACMLKVGENVVDIGTDHAYLPIYLITNNMCKNVIGMDVNKGPLEKAQKNIKSYGVEDRITLRISNGFEKLKDDEAQSAVITGMGGELIVKILSEGKDKVDKLQELVLSAQSEIFKLRKYLNDSGYIIDEETMIWEDNKFYQLLHVVKGIEPAFSSVELKYGRHLIGNKNQVLRQFLELENSKCEKTIAELKCATESQLVNSRIEELEQLLAENMEVLSQL